MNAPMGNEPMDSDAIIVVGAGIVGTATAIAIYQRTGRDVRILEAGSPASYDEGTVDLRVSAISPASRQVLMHLGVWAAVSKSLEPRCHYEHMRVFNGLEADGLHFDAASIGELDLGHIIENNLLSQRLQQRCAELGIRIDYDSSITAVQNSDHGPASITLANGDVLPAALIVGADGGRSLVRGAAGISVSQKSYQQHGLVCVVKTAEHHQHTAWQRFLNTGPLAFLPLRDGLSSIVWSLPTAQAQALKSLSEDDFNAALTAAFPDLGACTVQSARASFPLSLSMAEHYHQDRVVLVGDAAHVIHPLAGQGVNLGLADAAELAEQLSRYPQHRALKAYQRRRKLENGKLIKLTDGLDRLFAQPELHDLRQVGMSAINRTILRRMLGKMALGYVPGNRYLERQV